MLKPILAKLRPSTTDSTSTATPLRTRPVEVLVHNRTRHALVLEILSSNDKGKRIPVPLRHQTYSDALQQTICSLDVETQHTVTLISDVDPPNWRLDTITNHDP